MSHILVVTVRPDAAEVIRSAYPNAVVRAVAEPGDGGLGEAAAATEGEQQPAFTAEGIPQRKEPGSRQHPPRKPQIYPRQKSIEPHQPLTCAGCPQITHG